MRRGKHRFPLFFVRMNLFSQLCSMRLYTVMTMRSKWFFILMGLVCFMVISCQEDHTDKQSPSIDTVDSKYEPQIKVAQKAIGKGEFEKAKEILFSIKRNIDLNPDSSEYQYVSAHLGVLYYQSQIIDSAIYFWRETERYTGNDRLNQNAAANLSNLGSAYMSKGLFQSAISYFVEAKEIFEALGEKNENFWVNHLNIGVSHMETGNLKKAEQVFVQIPGDLSANMSAIKYINLAKLFALKNQENTFRYWLALAKNQIENSTFYERVYDEVFLEFALKFKNRNMLSREIDRLVMDYGNGSMNYDLLLCEALIFLDKPLPDDFFEMKGKLGQQDHVLNQQFHHLMSVYYESKEQFAQALDHHKQFQEEGNSLKEERNAQELLDYSILSERKDMAMALEKQKEQNEIQAQRLKAQIYFIAALVFLIVLLFLGGFFFYNAQKAKARDSEERINVQNLQLNWVKKEQERLQQDLQFKSSKLQSVLNTVTKLAILKKQIDGFFKSLDDSKQVDASSKTLLKRLRLDFNSFFNNYQELAVIANLDGEDTKKAEIVKLRFPSLNENEQRVVLFIIQKYTSKEMATLLSCSEKNIEYYRSQIRRKLDIDKEKNLLDFLDSELKSIQL